MLKPVNLERLPEVLWEQLTYLMRHYHQHYGVHPSECEQCSRFKQVEKLLLTPFEIKEYKIQLSKSLLKARHAKGKTR